MRRCEQSECDATPHRMRAMQSGVSFSQEVHVTRTVLTWQAPKVGYIRSKKQEHQMVQASIDTARGKIFRLRAQVAERRKEMAQAAKLGLKERMAQLQQEMYFLEKSQERLLADVHERSKRENVLSRDIDESRKRLHRHKVDMLSFCQ